MSAPIRTRAQLRALATMDKHGHGLLKKKGLKTNVVKIYEDGTILRIDVYADVATPMTVREAVKFLRL